MLTSSQETEIIPSKNNTENNNFTYISTYNMGKIGIKKIVEEPSKTQLNTNNDNKLLIPSYQVNSNITNNTNNNTNNTNTNTNTNTNNNTSKNRDIQTSKKKLKNHHSVSPNFIHAQSSSNSKYYKAKNNQRMNCIKKNNLKPSLTQIKLAKKQFSKSTNNFYIPINTSKNKGNYKYINNKSYSKKKIKSNTKLMKKRKITDGNIKYHSNHSSCVFSYMIPSSIKRQKKKYSISNIMMNESNNNNINSFKRDISEIYIKNNNLSSTELDSNPMKLLLNEDKIKKINKNNKNYNTNTENNVDYLRVRKRKDLPHNINNNNINNLKMESTPLINNNNSKIKISPPSSNAIKENIDKNINITEINLSEKQKNNNCLDSNISNEEYGNIIECIDIPKLKLDSDIKDSNVIFEQKLINQSLKLNNIIEDNNNNNENENINIKNININISCSNSNYMNESQTNNKDKNKEKDIENKNREKKGEIIEIKKININFNNKKNINNQKKNQNKVKNVEINKCNTSVHKFNNFKNKNNISNLKNVQTENNTKLINISKKTRNNENITKSNSKNKFGSKSRKNYSSNKIKSFKKQYNSKMYKMKSNRYKSNENKNYKNKVISLNKKMNNITITKTNIKDEKKEETDFESPEEMHYFMVNLSINYKLLKENF